MIIYTDRFIPAGFDAHAIFAPLILIRPNRRGDAGIIAHERKHCRDIWRCGWLVCGLLYLVSRRFRLWFELRGYREELKHDPARLYRLAFEISKRFKLPGKEAVDILNRSLH